MVFIRQCCYHLRHEFRDVFFFGGGSGAGIRGGEESGTQNGIPSCRCQSSGINGIKRVSLN